MTTRSPELTWGCAGPCAVRIAHSEAPSPTTTLELLALESQLKSHFGEGIVDAVPGFQTLTLFIDHRSCSLESLGSYVDEITIEELAVTEIGGKELELPVYYASEVGADLERVADCCGVSVDELIDLHTGTTYHAYANGFAPGFCYLGEIPEKIATPRLATPRRQVPAGSVAIADRQTAVYPIASPGGWNLLGRCPTPLFDRRSAPPATINVGDRVRFKAIDREEYLALGGGL